MTTSFVDCRKLVRQGWARQHRHKTLFPGLKARNVIAWAEASHASEAQVDSTP